MNRLPPLSKDRLPAIVESILFVAEEPVSISTLGKALRRSTEDIDQALAILEERYEEGGISLQRNDGLVQLVSSPDAGPYVERFLGIESRQRLSSAALESLAIIAYRQPVTRAGVE
jgi:segregation and condensation protein B